MHNINHLSPPPIEGEGQCKDNKNDLRRVVLITGASSGIGETCAVNLSSEYRLILAGRNRQKLEETREKCFNKDSHLIWCCDLTTEIDNISSSLIGVLKKHNIVVSAFVHCAGISKICPFKSVPKSYQNEIFNVNFFSAVEIIQSLLKRVNQNALENIVLISSVSSVRADKGNSIYAASKGAINALVTTLASELAPSVRVNAIAPGTTSTPMSSEFIARNGDTLNNLIPLGIGRTEDIANMTVFLISKNARWITGQTIFIDGGLTIIGV